MTIENYENLKIALQEIIDEINNFKEKSIDKKIFKIDLTQGGDLKWLANMHGLLAANSNHPCPYCTWNPKDGFNCLRTLCSRSHQEAKECIIKSKERLGYQNWPLLKIIEFKKAIFDPLHMCLRITDVLCELLIGHLDELELKNKKDQFDLIKRPLLKKLWDFCEKDCQVSSPLKLDEQEGKVTIRSLMLKVIKIFRISKN